MMTETEAILGELQARLRRRELVAQMVDSITPSLPASGIDVAAAEGRLGFVLPSLLRSIYTEVGNGGFGPGYGIIGLAGGASDHVGGRACTLVEVYKSFLGPPGRGEPWGEKLLPICHWGCGIYSYLDCALPEAPVMAIDPNRHGHGPGDCAFSLHARSLEEWMIRWLKGENLWESISLCGEPKLWFEEHPEEAAQSEAMGGHEGLMRRISALREVQGRANNPVVRFPTPPARW